MGVLDEAIRDHLELRRRHGASDSEIARAEAEALGPARRDPAADIFSDEGPAADETTVLDPVAQEDLARPFDEGYEPSGPVDSEGETAVYDLDHDLREAPVEEAPVEEAPVEEAPVEEPPVDEPPVEEPPVEAPPFDDERPFEDEPAPDSPPAEDESPVRPAFPDDEPPPRPPHPEDQP